MTQTTSKRGREADLKTVLTKHLVLRLLPASVATPALFVESMDLLLASDFPTVVPGFSREAFVCDFVLSVLVFAVLDVPPPGCVPSSVCPI